MKSRFLILETSQRIGKVALALDDAIVGERTLDESRRHARSGSRRQGIARAARLAGARPPGRHREPWAGQLYRAARRHHVGENACVCDRLRVLAIDTFEAIAAQAPATQQDVDVIANAQQDKVYVQRFGTHREPLTVLPLSMWLESRWHGTLP